MRKLLLMLLASLVLVLGACAESEDKEVESLESSEKDSEDVSEDEEAEADDVEEETKELDQTLVDNDNLKAVVTGIKKIDDKEWDEERYEISIEIDNNREDTIEVQAHEVSADGVMIDDMVFMSETVSAGKHANAIMGIENYEGDLPEMEEELEFILSVYSDEDYEYEEEHDVKIEF